jgi:glycosyltransferase involved in cell wall biosynthesis
MVGPAAATWPGAEAVVTSVNPVAWFGQRSVGRVPPADRAFHPHQTRPLHRIPAASCVLDLIQLQDPFPPLRLAKALRLRASVRAARALFTITSSVRDELVADFGVDPASVTVLRLPVDPAASARVAAARATAPRRPRPSAPYLLALGRFDPHKNLPRLIAAFARTRFAARGGELRLGGGTVARLRAPGVGPLPRGVRVLGRLDQAGLERALAGATALVQASLVEGFGLPVAEALVAGVPVVSSPIPAVTEFGPPGVPTFDPRSVPDMAEAIDRTVELVEDGRYWDTVDRASWLAARPTPRTLAEQVLAGLAGVGAQ